MSSVEKQRQELIRSLFLKGIPALWCPPITHYSDDGSIDFPRMSAHFAFMSPHVKGVLIPGSTGDGWELNEEETLALAQWAIEQGRASGTSILLGVLRTQTEEMLATLQTMLALIRQTTGVYDPHEALAAAGVCGFALCPPRGNGLSQQQIETGFARVLDEGLPIALYQLPQVTENEVSPETFAALVERYPNLIMVKDTSGEDRIVPSSAPRENVFFVRGAEGAYARWLKGTGGVYDGFLLSSANSFPAQLAAIVRDIEGERLDAARATSEGVAAVIREVFALVQPFPHGNAFANANKAIDLFNAYGPSANRAEPPMLHAGVRLPKEVITATGEILARHGLLPAKGYLG